jgi:hypothetical protein
MSFVKDSVNTSNILKGLVEDSDNQIKSSINSVEDTNYKNIEKTHIVVNATLIENKGFVLSHNDKYNFVFQTMLTCIGNKRKLVSNIGSIVDEVRTILNKDKLNIVDGFAGSSVVSRELSYVSDNLYSNDMEYYSYLMSQCYLVNPSDDDKNYIIEHIHKWSIY